MLLFEKLDDNVNYLSDVFDKCADVVSRKFIIGEHKKTPLYISYMEMLVNREAIEERIFKPIMMTSPVKFDVSQVSSLLLDSGIPTADIRTAKDTDELEDAILSGDTVILFDGETEAFIIATRGWPNRGVAETETEVVVLGSKEAFNESMRFSTTLIRRRIRDSHLKLEQMKIGRRSKTDVGVMYIKGIVRESILEETINRLENINIDAILDCGNIEQFIEEDWISPFPQVQTTERPDKAASALLEGRIVIAVDNSPVVLIVPATLNCFYQASEDYYQRWQIMSLARLLRFIAGFMALSLPALYLSTAVYHPSMLPTLLTYKMAGARSTVPFPAVIEILIMDFAFELLREAGIRLPGPIGNTIGIVGGLIIGQAAVEAGLVSPIVVIIVALTGISGFTIPSVSLVNGFRIMKFLLIITSAIFGLFGFWLGLLIILIHLASLKSFGIPYLYPFASAELGGYADFQDSIIRMPLFLMKKRPIFARPNEKRRLITPNTGNKRAKE